MKYFLSCIAVTVLCLCSQSTYSQPIDSLLQIVATAGTEQEIDEALRQIDQQTSDLSHQEKIDLYENLLTTPVAEQPIVKYYLYRRLSNSAWRVNKLDNAVAYGQNMLNNAEQNSENQINAHAILAHKFFYHNQIDSTLFHANAVEKLAVDLESDQVWKAYERKAWVYETMGEEERFLEQFDKLISFFKQHPEHSQKGFILYRIANYFYQSEDWEAFDKYSTDFFTYYSEKTPIIPKGHVPINQMLLQGEPETVIANLITAKSYKKDELISLVSITHNLARAYGNFGRPTKGINELLEIISIHKDAMQVKDLASSYLLLSRLYEQAGNYSAANQNLNQFLSTYDTYQSALRAKDFAKMEVEYDTARKENELALSNMELTKVKRERLALILGLVCLVGISALLYRLIRLRKRANKVLAQKSEIIANALQEKEVLLREIHHRVKNNLQVVSSLLSLQSRGLSDETAKTAMTESRNRVQSMALIHQNLYQDQDLMGVNTADYIEKLTTNLVQNYSLKQVDVETDIDNLSLDVDIMIPLGLILNELITNSLKYAFDDHEKGKIEVRLKQHATGLQLQVIDNGKGLPEGFENNKQNSMGFRLIDAFTRKLKATMEVLNPEIGTGIQISIPQAEVAAA